MAVFVANTFTVFLQKGASQQIRHNTWFSCSDSLGQTLRGYKWSFMFCSRQWMSYWKLINCSIEFKSDDSCQLRLLFLVCLSFPVIILTYLYWTCWELWVRCAMYLPWVEQNLRNYEFLKNVLGTMENLKPEEVLVICHSTSHLPCHTHGKI